MGNQHKKATQRHENGIESLCKNHELVGIKGTFEKRKNYEFKGKNKSNNPSELEIDIIFYNQDKSYFIEYKGTTNGNNGKKAKRQLEVIRKNLKNIEQKFLSPEMHYIYVGGDPKSPNKEVKELNGSEWNEFP